MATKALGVETAVYLSLCGAPGLTGISESDCLLAAALTYNRLSQTLTAPQFT